MNGRDLRKAADNGDDKLIDQILESKEIDINEAGPDSLKTPLHRAAGKGHVSTTKKILSHKPKVNCQDKAGKSPLHDIIESKESVYTKIEIINLLLDQGADPILEDLQKITPMMSFKAVKEDKEIANKSETVAQINLIIRKMKKFIENRASELQKSARIRPSGEVIFENVATLILNQQPSDVDKSGEIRIKQISL